MAIKLFTNVTFQARSSVLKQFAKHYKFTKFAQYMWIVQVQQK